MATGRIGPEALRRIASARFAEGWTWARIARELQCDAKTLYRHRQTPEWAEAMKSVVDEMKSDGIITAWGCLLRQCERGSVAAAKTILDRLEGAEEEPSRMLPLFIALRRGEITEEEYEERARAGETSA